MAIRLSDEEFDVLAGQGSPQDLDSLNPEELNYLQHRLSNREAGRTLANNRWTGFQYQPPPKPEGDLSGVAPGIPVPSLENKDRLARLRKAESIGAVPTNKGMVDLNALANGWRTPRQGSTLTERFAPELTPEQAPGLASPQFARNTARDAATLGLGTVDLLTLAPKAAYEMATQGPGPNTEAFGNMLAGSVQFAYDAITKTGGSAVDTLTKSLPGIGPYIHTYLQAAGIGEEEFQKAFLQNPVGITLTVLAPAMERGMKGQGEAAPEAGVAERRVNPAQRETFNAEMGRRIEEAKASFDMSDPKQAALIERGLSDALREEYYKRNQVGTPSPEEGIKGTPLDAEALGEKARAEAEKGMQETEALASEAKFQPPEEAPPAPPPEEGGPVLGSALGALQGLKFPERTTTPLGQIGVEVAQDLTSKVPSGALFDKGRWATEVVKAAKEKGLKVTGPQLDKLWSSEDVRIARTPMKQLNPEGFPAPKGEAKAFVREALDTRLGLSHFWTSRRAQMSTAMIRDLVKKDTNQLFNKNWKTLWRGLTPEENRDLYITRAANYSPDEYGAFVRAGEMSTKEAKAYIAETGTRLREDGSFFGPAKAGKTGIYRVFTPEQGKALLTAFSEKHPDLKPLLDTLFSVEEERQVLTPMGDAMPLRGYKNIREQYSVEGFKEVAEVNKIAQELGLIKEPLQFSYVPDLATTRSPRSVFGRLRNYLSFATAAARRKKTGSTFEAIYKGEATPDVGESTRLAREGLAIERIHNNAVLQHMALALEPIDPEVGIKPGYTALGRKMFGSAKWDRWLAQNERTFKEELGAHLDEGEVPEGSKRWQMTEGMKRMLSPMFEDQFVSSDPKWQGRHDAILNGAEAIIGAINTAKLVAPQTQVTQQLVGNTMLMGVKLLRDAYRPFIEAAIPDKEGQWLTNVNNSLIQLASDVRGLPQALSPKGLRRVPGEMLGETSVRDVAGGTANWRQVQAAALTGMRLSDTLYKRWSVESSLDSAARVAFNEAKKKGQVEGWKDASTTERLSIKSKWIDNYRSNVPREVELLSYLEMDTWAFDFENTNRVIRALRGTGDRSSPWRWVGLAGRMTIPYPTWIYKLYNNFYGELSNSFKQIAHPRSRKDFVNAVATVGAFTTALTAAYQWYSSHRPKDVEAANQALTPVGGGAAPPPQVGESDLPYPLRKSMRMPFNIKGEEYWNNIAQVPIISEAAYLYETTEGGVAPEDIFNSRMGLGILPQVLMIAKGASDNYNKNLPMAGKVGKFVATLPPGNVELNFIRKMRDPFRRDTTVVGDKWYQQFWRAFQDNYPILSERLQPAFRRGTKEFLMYNPKEVTLSFLIGNTTLPDEGERQAAISAAALAALEQTNMQYDEDQLRKILLPLMDQKGDTASTPLLKAIREGQANYEVKWLDLQLRMKRAFHTNGGGLEAASKVLTDYLATVEDPNIKGRLGKAAPPFLLKLEKGKALSPFLQDFLQAPPELQYQFAPQLNEQEKQKALQELPPQAQ